MRFIPSLYYFRWTTLFVALTLLCVPATKVYAQGARTIVVSVEPLADLVDRLTAGRIPIVVMIPVGANHDTYEPTIDQLKAVSAAALFVKVGHPSFTFETTWLDQLIAEHPLAKVVDCSKGITQREGDPHIWLSPKSLSVIAKSIADGLQTTFPDEASLIQRNLVALSAEISRTDQEIGEILATKRGAAFLVFHSAWSYFAADYGLTQLAIESEGKEADTKSIADIVREARRRGLKTVLIQPQFSTESAELVAYELGGTVKAIQPEARDLLPNLVRSAKIIAEASAK